MASSLDRSKFYPPKAPVEFYRQRLLTQLKENRNKTLLLLVGQAGQGKSTLVTKFIESAERPTIWVNSDPTDVDPASFLVSLITAFQYRWEHLDFTPVINNLGTPVSENNPHTIYILWSRAFWQIAPKPVRIVLDALEQVPESSPTYHLIDALIQAAPPSVQIILTSRMRPPLKVERLKVENQALVIENESLSFTPHETASFLRNTLRLSLKDEAVRFLNAYTEGWLVGIIIIAHLLDRDKRDDQLSALVKRLENHTPRQIYTYISEEIFNALSSADQRFLIQTAFLEILEPELIDNLLQNPHSGATLQRLAEKYLFIHTFTDKAGNLFFRHHQIFRRFLLHQFKNAVRPSVQRNLYLKTARHFADRDLLESSLPYFLQACQYARAERALRKIGLKLVNRGQTARLSAYLERFPARERRQSAWLSWFYAISIRTKETTQALEQLCRCREMFSRDNDDTGCILTLSYLIETAFLIGHSPVDMDQLLAESRMQLVDAADIPGDIQAQLWLQIGFAAIRGIGNFSEALSACQTAFLLAKETDNINIQCHSLILSKLASAYLGEFQQADTLNDRIDRLLPNCSTEIQTFNLSAQCLLNIYRGRKQEALIELQQLEADIEKYGFNHFFTWLIIYKCLLYPRIGRLTEAEQILAGWLNVSPEPNFRRAMALLFVGFCAYYRSAVTEGMAALEESAAIFNQGPLRSEFQYQAARKALGIAAYLNRDYTAADVFLEETLTYALTIKSHTLTADAHILIGLNKYAAQDLTAATRHLGAGFDIATSRRISQMVVARKEDLACACLLALKLRVLKDLSWVRQLLVDNANTAIVHELEELITSTNNTGLKRVLKDSHQAILRARLPVMEICTLHEFSVFLNDAPIPQVRWQSAGAQRLLAVLLALGGRNVPQDLIMDALWPEASPKAVQNNLKSALHRLRKAINPQLGRYQRSVYLQVRNGRVGLDPTLCKIDFEEFDKTAQKALKETDQTQKAKLACEALEIYRGDFIPSELYIPYVNDQRDHLKATYLKLLALLSAIHDKNGEHGPALECLEEWLAADPYSDTACRRLMRTYQKMDLPNRAIRLFNEFETRLESDLEVAPEPETRSLFQKITNQI